METWPDDPTMFDVARHPGSYGAAQKALVLDKLADEVESLRAAVEPLELALADTMAERDTLFARLRQIETRAQQIRGGLKPYARPVEIVDYLMGDQA